MKKKILIFSLAYYPKHIGGAEVAIKEITDRISPEDYEFHMICNGYDSTLPKNEKIGNVNVHRIGLTGSQPTMQDLRKFPLHLNKIIFQWTAFWFAKKLHRKEKFDGIWAMMAHSCGISAVKFKKAFPSVKYLLTLQEGDPPAYIAKKMRVFGELFKESFVRADTIQVISNFLGNWAKEQGFPGDPVLIPNAVDTEHFTQTFSDKELSEVRREYMVEDTDVLLVTTSRLVHKNAVDDVIEAVALLPEHVKFIVFGTGPDEELLRKRIGKLNLEDRVFLRGQINHCVMPKYIKACDIFIRPSRSEGMGNSFVEAMAASLPVIATQEGGIADFLFDKKRNPELGITGWAVDADSPEQIKLAVEDIVANPEKVSEVTQRAKEMVIKKYDWNLIADKMNKEVFKKLYK
ncbi:MAG: glycosyltransferase family 4 protein [Candidatus Pacebacteria bacterium]|nr:glycosyltransferase family 4 protein [Candidatus Paceibacterota bacterium]